MRDSSFEMGTEQ